MKYSEIKIVIIGFVSTMVFLFLLRYHIYLLPSGHGYEFQILMRYLFEWLPPFKQNLFDHLHGLSALFGTHPMQVWWNPGLWPFAWFKDTYFQLLFSGMIFSALLYSSVVFLGRALALSFFQSIVTAQIILFCIVAPGIIINFTLQTHLIYLPICVWNIALGLFILLGNKTKLVNIIIIILMPIFVIYNLFCDVIYSIAHAPIYVLFGSFILINTRKNNYEWLWKLIGIIYSLIFLYFTNIIDYLYVFIKYNARALYINEISLNSAYHLNFGSLFVTNPALFIFIFIGILLAIKFDKIYKNISIFALLILFLFIIYDGVFYLLGINWPYPKPVYVQTGAIVFYMFSLTVGYSAFFIFYLDYIERVISAQKNNSAFQRMINIVKNKEKTLFTIWGVLLIVLGLILNEKFLTAMFSKDGILDDHMKYAILTFDVLLIGFGLLITFMPSSRVLAKNIIEWLFMTIKYGPYQRKMYVLIIIISCLFSLLSAPLSILASWNSALNLGRRISKDFDSFVIKKMGMNSLPLIDKDRYVAETEITNFLKNEIAIKPGASFRGSVVVNYYGIDDGPIAKRIGAKQEQPFDVNVWNKSWMEVNKEFGYKHWGGGTHAENDLLFYDIPSIEQYSLLLTPQSYLYYSRMFYNENDLPFHNVVVVVNIKKRILKGLGVRFIITDKELYDSDYVLKKEISGKTGLQLRLYEIINSNIANYSPINVYKSNNGKETLDILNMDSFDFEDDVILTNNISNVILNKVSESTMILEKLGIRVKAYSDGMSILLLPVEYSNCLKFENMNLNKEIVKPVILRANFLQTAVLFNSELNILIDNQFSMFTPNCRQNDINDMKSMGLRDLEVKRDMPAWLYPYSLKNILSKSSDSIK